MKRLTDIFIRHVELWLSALGLILIFVIVLLFAPDGDSVWRTATIAAVTIGVLHGIIFWLIRRRQRRLRQEAIEEIRDMLSDVVKNQLAVIGVCLPDAPGAGQRQRRAVGHIRDSLARIALLIDSISEDSLQHWQATYATSVEASDEVEELV